MPDEEVDFDQAKPLKLAAEVSPEKTVKFFQGEEANPLQPKELTEDLLSKYYDASLELDLLAKQVEMMKKDIKELGKGVETIQKGKFIAMFKEAKGRRTVEWDRLAKDLIGKLSDEDIAKYTKQGEPSVRLEVRKL